MKGAGIQLGGAVLGLWGVGFPYLRVCATMSAGSELRVQGCRL